MKGKRSEYTSLRESATRKKIDHWLSNLGWDIDEESPSCNVSTERVFTKGQKEKLQGNKPDYIFYKRGTTQILATVEAKAKGENIDVALNEAIEKYAKPLNIPIVIATDGSFFRSMHMRDQKPLFIDGENVNELLAESTILRFIDEGHSILSTTPQIQYTREQLISIFKWTNDKLRKEGLRQGVERFTEFSNLLFLKLISEIENHNEKQGLSRRLARKYCWESFSTLDGVRMMEYINNVVLPELVGRYNDSGDVFKEKLGFKSTETLKSIVDKLSGLPLINIDSDIKGDAFEYFLKDSITVGNDLGEYFTPRHIVRLMVNLIDPQFGEKIYDPTCGTGGFLIQAFRHIKQRCKLTPENRNVLEKKTVYGRELTNTSRIAKMNMILVGDGHTNIKQMDSLQNPVKEEYDVVLANPPYGQETDWGHLYKVDSKQADCVFIQHIMDSLNESGRAAVIVPEGFLFRLGADQKVRELLLKNFNVDAVISLPAGVFQPYTASKVNIIVFRRGVGATKKVWFYEINNDGFDLGATRRPISENDLPDLRSKWQDKPASLNSWETSIEEIENSNWMIIASIYKPETNITISYPDPIIILDQIIEHQQKITKQLSDLRKELLEGEN